MLMCWVGLVSWFQARGRREEGQGLVEYALIIALVAILLVGALMALKDGIAASLANSAAAL